MVFVFLWLGSLSIFSFVGLALVHLFMGVPVLTEPHLIDEIMQQRNLGSVRLLQIVTSIGAFIVPGWLFVKVLDFDLAVKKNDLVLVLLSVLLPLIALPLVDWLATINGLLTFPIESIDDWMKLKELQASKIYEDFLKMNGSTDLAINLVMMALIPAIGEELLFRAGLQQYLGRHLGNGHVAIWITAILFSAIHFQFYTFIPRLIMGAGLGYLFYFGGNISYSILAHFVNNAAAVVLAYLSGRVFSEELFENSSSGLSLWVIGGMALVGLMMFVFYRKSKNWT